MNHVIKLQKLLSLFSECSLLLALIMVNDLLFFQTINACSFKKIMKNVDKSSHFVSKTVPKTPKTPCFQS